MEKKIVKKIDIHVHASESGWPAFEGDIAFATPEELIAMYDELGIEMGVLLPELPDSAFVTSSNYEIWRVTQKYPDRFTWFCNFEPWQVKNSPDLDFVPALQWCKDKGAKGFTTNFDDLGDVDMECNYFDQIPGLASQRLMAEGYGFGAEGDWKSAALYRTVWVMNQGLSGGCSFLEDYTLNFDGADSSILQSHMLEICPMIAAAKPRLEVHFLGIGIRKSQTARLVFTSKVGTGCTATVVDLGNRFRLIVNDVQCIEPKPLPKLPVASALWIPMPDFEVGAGAWILAGGTHHSCFSYDLTSEYWEDYAEISGIEMVHINKDTTISGFKKELRMNEVYYMLNKALV